MQVGGNLLRGAALRRPFNDLEAKQQVFLGFPGTPTTCQLLALEVG